MFYLDLLNLHPQFFQRPMPIHAIGDVISEAVAHHPFPIRFPDAVGLTQSAEGMAGRSGAFYYKILLDFYLKICIIAEKAGLFTEDDVANWITQSRREEATE